MHRSKPRTRASAATRAHRSSSSPALPADAMHLVDLLDAHLDRLHAVRALLWAMSAVLDRAAGETTLSRAVGFELQQLAKAGLCLAGDSLEILSEERRSLDASEQIFHP